MAKKFIPASCGGEKCTVCGKPAERKVEEVIFSDDPVQQRHPFTAYLCLADFNTVMGHRAAPKFIEFQQRRELHARKPCFWVVNKKSDTVIGQIFWYTPWKMFTFMAKDETVWSEDCLADIRAFIRLQTVIQK